MPIITSDIVWRYSAPGAAAGGTTAGTTGQSLGRYVANNVIPDGVLNNLFPDVTGDENRNLNVDYQCVFVHNTHLTLTLIEPRVWIGDVGPTNTVKAIALDAVAPSVYGSSTAQAAVIADKNTAPVVSGAFQTLTTKSTGISLGDLAPGSVRAVWIRRTATNSAALSNDYLTVRVEGDTLQ